MISTPNRKLAVDLINEERAAGARLQPACEVLNISDRTYQRWVKEGDVVEDQRPIVKRPTPKNKLTKEERAEVIQTVNSPEFAVLVPSQIVPKLANEGKYIASESTIHRILKEEKMDAYRARTKEPVKREIPTHIATAPNQVWTWDITWLNGSVKGHYYKLYLMLDMFSRFIVAYEVWETENAKYAERLIKKTVSYFAVK